MLNYITKTLSRLCSRSTSIKVCILDSIKCALKTPKLHHHKLLKRDLKQDRYVPFRLTTKSTDHSRILLLHYFQFNQSKQIL